MSDNKTGNDQHTQVVTAAKVITREPMLNLSAALLLSAPFAGYYLANAFGGALGFTVTLVGMFLLAFTGSPTPARMGWMVRYCYFFCFLAVATAIVPFFLLDASIDGSSPMNRKVSDKTSMAEGMQTSLNRYLMGNKAIGVVVGCRKVGTDKPVQPYVDCEQSGFQWVVHIGGTLNKVTGANKQSDANRYAESSTSPGFQYAGYQLPATSSGADWAVLASAMKDGILTDKMQEVPKRYFVEGGIIFPLYLIVISLIGGAVSLTRRVPVMQCHLWANTQEVAMDKRYKVRQDLILQMMQFVSAPFVAVIAFSMLEPTSVAMAVGGAFLSGFASEYVLLTISNLFDKLKPEAATKSE
jgi:hypothetical protein